MVANAGTLLASRFFGLPGCTAIALLGAIRPAGPAGHGLCWDTISREREEGGKSGVKGVRVEERMVVMVGQGW